VRRDVERQQEERQRRLSWVQSTQQREEAGRRETVGDHVEDGAEVARLAEEAGEPAVELVADETDGVFSFFLFLFLARGFSFFFLLLPSQQQTENRNRQPPHLKK
jgi:hypothetical protein